MIYNLIFNLCKWNLIPSDVYFIRSPFSLCSFDLRHVYLSSFSSSPSSSSSSSLRLHYDVFLSTSLRLIRKIFVCYSLDFFFFARWFCACHIWSNVWSWRCLFVCLLATFFHSYSIFYFSLGLSTNVITVKRDELWMRHFIRNTPWANGK